jgi:UDP-N-acetyl-D-mannosaminuronic acid transferase (WecB/TagA/CpsF family)
MNQIARTMPTRKILGVDFFCGTPDQAAQFGLAGGLVVVPAAPALIELSRDPNYRDALLGADLVITDSGLMVLLWRLFRREKLIRVSGLEYLRLILKAPALRDPGSVAWVMPTAKARDRNLTWLRSAGFPFTEADCYLAPMYPAGAIRDQALLAWLNEHQPKQVIVGLGGGTQERLGYFLRNHLAYRPGIHCIGAAIGFVSGEQVKIPVWADYLFLGWFFRCLHEPGKFIPRYWHAKRLISLMWRYGENLPPLDSRPH